jgi:hypothetical protein
MIRLHTKGLVLIMSSIIKVVDSYKDFAQKHAHKHTTSVHIALIVKRGKVIAVGGNSVGSQSMGSGYGCHGTIHAEKAVVKQLGDISELKGATLVVVRLGRKCNDWCYSAPCCSCKKFLTKCITHYGLSKVYYS